MDPVPLLGAHRPAWEADGDESNQYMPQYKVGACDEKKIKLGKGSGRAGVEGQGQGRPLGGGAVTVGSWVKKGSLERTWGKGLPGRGNGQPTGTTAGIFEG